MPSRCQCIAALIWVSTLVTVYAESMYVRRLGVVGGGLAGLSTSLEARRVWRRLSESMPFEIIIFEKEARIGGNSVKASSGFNAIDEKEGPEVEAFLEDTRVSGGGMSDEELVQTLVHQSGEAKAFLESFGVDLSGLTRLGGHSRSRTRFDPMGANIGASIMRKLIEAVQAEPKIKIITSAPVTRVEPRHAGGSPSFVVHHGEDATEVHALVLATGGFGANKTLLEHYSKRASVYSTTNGPWSTGDGLELGKELSANLIHLEEVQVHPTGFVDPKDPDAGSRVLAAEKLRGCGAILLNMEGHRFVDELNRRDHVFGKLSQQTGEKAWMLLSGAGAATYNVSHLAFYIGRGLLIKMDSLEALAAHTSLPEAVLREELSNYNDACAAESDAFGKKSFPSKFDLDEEIYVSMITPVVHYTMGGVQINKDAQAMCRDPHKGEVPIPGLYAAGEVSGGLHGKNRLGGNSLLDCVVFGRQAGSHAMHFLAETPLHEEL